MHDCIHLVAESKNIQTWKSPWLAHYSTDIRLLFLSAIHVAQPPNWGTSRSSSKSVLCALPSHVWPRPHRQVLQRKHYCHRDWNTNLLLADKCLINTTIKNKVNLSLCKQENILFFFFNFCFFQDLLRYNWQITLCKFKVCNVVIWYTDIFGDTMETVTDFIFLGSKITADGDCSHEIKRPLLLGRKAMTNLDSILKNRHITLPTKVA